jgi:hypothetical protein
MNKQTLISVVVIGLAVIVGLIILQSASNKSANRPGEYDTLASCIAESGATFYGAFWCPHCNNQKKAFGKSEKFLPYVECSTPDGNGQTQVCIENEIQSYPTWILADGTRLAGTQSVEGLAAATGCEAFLEGNTEEMELEDLGETSEITQEAE